jgi:hypothetical protein
MRTRAHGFAAATAFLLVATACEPVETRRTNLVLDQGRQYTAWLYQEKYQRLWLRMAPEMRDLFDGPRDLRAFTGMLDDLGEEQRVLGEAVDEMESERVYSRTVAFSKAPRPVVIQWAMNESGLVSGLAVRPVPESQLTLGGEE